MESANEIIRKAKAFRFRSESIIVFYKVLHDALLVEIAFFALAILAESIIPGIIIAHIGFSKIVILVALTMVATAWLGRSEAISRLEIKQPKRKKKTLVAFVIFAAFVMFNSEFKLNVFLNISIIALSFAIGYLAFGILNEKETD